MTATRTPFGGLCRGGTEDLTSVAAEEHGFPAACSAAVAHFLTSSLSSFTAPVLSCPLPFKTRQCPCARWPGKGHSMSSGRGNPPSEFPKRGLTSRPDRRRGCRQRGGVCGVPGGVPGLISGFGRLCSSETITQKTPPGLCRFGGVALINFPFSGMHRSLQHTVTNGFLHSSARLAPNTLPAIGRRP